MKNESLANLIERGFLLLIFSESTCFENKHSITATNAVEGFENSKALKRKHNFHAELCNYSGLCVVD